MTVSSSSKGEDGDANRSGRNWHTQMVGDLEIEGAPVEVASWATRIIEWTGLAIQLTSLRGKQCAAKSSCSPFCRA
ncbi:bsr3674 [Bradyrhizobium diazoefficiens USDA 110]|uniref:Bsr3674 protein n=2 Tax=Bradyrhizobium diazoefficiens TaxID=1355477 RepID=Q89P09_BRADU|nr:hypothetical protein BJA5080_05033 [Bradyrhizobium diazoefficiens SEMIA 5080]PDT60227.1 hypothetical protein CO678_18160 [Bradyrhizobium diazoefficiens]QBP22447.1 hypothetical protein Bdiaspc4_18955 [Bradyrhizobium diazoefficiens]QHP71347.1 hypothetical protein EI171_31200 [Bradyrhizobium sp. LCT2]BAC48939.1 bsr3674 [Bradyrhizobium diazoefficiens USDA 110]